MSSSFDVTHHRAGRGVTTYDELDELESTCTPHDA